jgi:hypothetical protein
MTWPRSSRTVRFATDNIDTTSMDLDPNKWDAETVLELPKWLDDQRSLGNGASMQEYAREQLKSLGVTFKVSAIR